MAVAGRRDAALHRQAGRRDEADEFEIGRTGGHLLELGEQAARRRAAGAEENPAARPDRRQGLLRAPKLRSKSRRSVVCRGAHLASSGRHALPPTSVSLYPTRSKDAAAPARPQGWQLKASGRTRAWSRIATCRLQHLALLAPDYRPHRRLIEQLRRSARRKPDTRAAMRLLPVTAVPLPGQRSGGVLPCPMAGQRLPPATGGGTRRGSPARSRRRWPGSGCRCRTPSA